MGLPIQEKKFKIYFQVGNCGGHLVFPIGTILAIFDLQVTSMILTKFQVHWPFDSGEEAKSRFSRWLPFWISDRNDFSYFDLSVSSQLAFDSGEEAKKKKKKKKKKKINKKNKIRKLRSVLAIF